MQETDIGITAMGMLTPVGLTAPQSIASMHAGISRLSDSSFMNSHFEPIVMALLPDGVLPELHPDLVPRLGFPARHRRLLQLAAPALAEAAADQQEPLPLYLGVPHPVGQQGKPVPNTFLQDLVLQSRVALDLDASRLFHEGRAAGLSALHAAVNMLNEGTHERMLVGGVDTFADLSTLAVLEAEKRLLMENRVFDGLIPGEGAAVLLLEKGQKSACSVRATAVGFEQGHRYSEEAYKGEGLANTCQALFQTLEKTQPVQTVYAGFNGEGFLAKGWGVTVIRNNDHLIEEPAIIHPADLCGDMGAATGILLTALAAADLGVQKVGAPALIWCAADHGETGAVLLG